MYGGFESFGGDDILEGSVGEWENNVEEEVRGESIFVVVEVEVVFIFFSFLVGNYGGKIWVGS